MIATVLLLLAAYAATLCDATLCKTQEPITNPPLGSRFPSASLANSVFSVDFSFPYQSLLAVPPDMFNASIGAPTPSFGWVLVSQATQQQLSSWQSWWVDPTSGAQSLFTLFCDGKYYPNQLINVTKITMGGSIRVFFYTPPNIYSTCNTLTMIPGGISPRWSGKILRAAESVDLPYRPRFIDTMAPWWLLGKAPSNQPGVQCLDNSTNTYWWMPAYSVCTDVGYRYPPYSNVSYSANIPFSSVLYQYNSTSKNLLVYLSATASGNATLDLTQAFNVQGYGVPQRVSSGVTTIKLEKGDPLMTAPAVQSSQIAHPIENLYSTSFDVPQYIVELDSAIMIQPLIASGAIPRPTAALYAGGNPWKLMNGTAAYYNNWTTAADIEKMYSFAWLQYSGSFEVYDLYLMNGQWYRQYGLYKVYYNGVFQNYAQMKHTLGCRMCTFRNYYSLYTSTFHYFYHNRADLYYLWTVQSTGWTIDHRLSITVSNGSTFTDTLSLKRNSNYTNSINSKFQAQSYGMDDDVNQTWTYYAMANNLYTIIEHRDAHGVPYSDPLMYINRTWADPSWVCGGLLTDETQILTITSRDICMDAIDDCLQNNVANLRADPYSRMAFEDSRGDGYVQPNKYGAGRWRARIGSGIYSIEYNPAFAITNWTTIIKIPSVTLVNA